MLGVYSYENILTFLDHEALTDPRIHITMLKYVTWFLLQEEVRALNDIVMFSEGDFAFFTKNAITLCPLFLNLRLPNEVRRRILLIFSLFMGCGSFSETSGLADISHFYFLVPLLALFLQWSFSYSPILSFFIFSFLTRQF